jgi:predicted enzyme related to lactoylglutathione lyase
MKNKRFSIPIAILLLLCGYLAGRAQSQGTQPAKSEPPAEQVTGIGGIFLKAQDPKKLAAWYRDNLGFPMKGAMAVFLWSEKDKPEQTGRTVWSLFPTNTTYFGASRSPVMINYRVPNLERMIEQLRRKGVTVEKTEDSDYGRFTWVTDPEGNRLELWEQKGK